MSIKTFFRPKKIDDLLASCIASDYELHSIKKITKRSKKLKMYPKRQIYTEHPKLRGKKPIVRFNE